MRNTRMHHRTKKRWSNHTGTEYRQIIYGMQCMYEETWISEMNILRKVFTKIRCINCTYYCMENLTDPTYCVHGHLNRMKNDIHYPKINKTCCPKDYPLTIYLRNLAGVWNS